MLARCRLSPLALGGQETLVPRLRSTFPGGRGGAAGTGATILTKTFMVEEFRGPITGVHRGHWPSVEELRGPISPQRDGAPSPFTSITQT